MFLKMCYGLDMKCLTQDHDLKPGFLTDAIWRISSSLAQLQPSPPVASMCTACPAATNYASPLSFDGMSLPPIKSFPRTRQHMLSVSRWSITPWTNLRKQNEVGRSSFTQHSWAPKAFYPALVD